MWSGSLGCPDSLYKEDTSDGKDHAITREYALSVCACDAYLAIGYNSGKVCVFDKTKDNQLACSWRAHSSSVRSMCFIKASLTEVNLLTGSDDYSTKRWDLSTRLAPSCIYTLHGHADAITCVRANEAIIITSSKDSTVRIWQGLCMGDEEDDMQTEGTVKEGLISPTATLHGHTGIVTCCDLSPCETKAISSGFDKVSFMHHCTVKSRISLLV